jgi:hypothetical protein
MTQHSEGSASNTIQEIAELPGTLSRAADRDAWKFGVAIAAKEALDVVNGVENAAAKTITDIASKHQGALEGMPGAEVAQQGIEKIGEIAKRFPSNEQIAVAVTETIIDGKLSPDAKRLVEGLESSVVGPLRPSSDQLNDALKATVERGDPGIGGDGRGGPLEKLSGAISSAVESCKQHFGSGMQGIDGGCFGGAPSIVPDKSQSVTSGVGGPS